jgi:protein TonB
MARDLDQVLYSFRPTPTSADLAIYMHRLGEQMASPAAHMPEAEPFAPPPPKAVPVAAPVVAAAAPAAAYTPSFETPSSAGYHEPAKKKSVPLFAIAAAVVLVIAGVIFMMTRGKGTGTAATNTAAKPVAAPPSTATAAGGVAGTAPLTASSATNTAAPTTTAPDQGKVDEEVRKRLEAERLRLEQNRAQQTPQQAQAAPPVTARPAPVVAQPVPAQQAAATPAPAPQPVVPAPQPVVENRPAPAPQPAAAEAPRTREGDLVPPGTEGLAPAHITRQAIPTYPPLARAQKVEGTVVVNVLVSEAGRVLDAKVLTGVNRPVGINEAAMQAVRNSSFAAGVKDGVRVKSWTTVVVAFKL